MREKIQIGVNSIKEFINEDTLRIIEVQRLRTFLRGTCYKLEPKFEVLYVPFRLRFRVTLNSSLPTSDMPQSVNLIFTSNKSWIGIPEETFPQSKPVYQAIDFSKERTNIYVYVNEKHFEEGVEDHHDCVKDYYMNRNCSYICSTFGAVSGLPPCLRPEQHKCMWNDWKSGNVTSLYNCFKSKKVTSYKLDTIEDPPHTDLNTTSTDIYIGIFSMYKTIEEEVPILTLPDLIGSIGGSLGLFLDSLFLLLYFTAEISSSIYPILIANAVPESGSSNYITLRQIDIFCCLKSIFHDHYTKMFKCSIIKKCCKTSFFIMAKSNCIQEGLVAS